MKPIQTLRSFSSFSASSLFFSGALYSQTVQINPVDAIPTSYALAQGWEWNQEADLEAWTASANLTLDSGTPSIDDLGPPALGSVKGTASGNDPTFTSPLTTIATPYRVIIEMRVRKEASDSTRLDLFWDDSLGGFGGSRVVSIPAATVAPDDTFKVIRITFPYGKISGQLDRLRFDPISDLVGVGKAVAIDYLRVYTETPRVLAWDVDAATTGSQGGTGVWDQEQSAWLDGMVNGVWPAEGAKAVFGGTAGGVTVAEEGVAANIIDFQSGGYTVDGGSIEIGSNFSIFSNSSGSTVTRIDSELRGSAPMHLVGGVFILGGNNSLLSGGVAQLGSKLGITGNNAVGTGTLTVGSGGNTFLSALNGDRSLANHVIFAGNRMVIDSDAFGTGLVVGNLVIDGNLALNCVSPGDLYLRKSLTVNGVVSGSNSGVGLLFAGDSNTLTLTNSNNFTGNIKWANQSVLAVNTDAALGAASNSLNFNGSSGTLKALDGFSSSRAIFINGNTTGKIDTNGFDVALSGKILGITTLANRTVFQKVGLGKLTLSGVDSNLYGGFRVDVGSLEFTGGSMVSAEWNGNYGVGGGASCRVLGGSVNISKYIAVGNGVTPGEEAQLVVDGGSFSCGLELLVGQNGNGRFVVSGGQVNLNQLSFGDGADETRTAVVDLNGGVLSMNRTNRRPGSASASINFNGTVITAEADQNDFLRGVGTATRYRLNSGGMILDTASFNIGIIVPLESGSVDGGLTKDGVGTLTIDAINTYTGDTKVNGGTLSVTGESIVDTGKLIINEGGVMGVSSDEVVGSLFYGEVQQVAGTYGSSDSGADFVDDLRFTGTGVLTVVSGVSVGGYSDWAASHANNQTADLDFDGDGVLNGVEYFMGESGSGFTGNPRVVAGKVTWPKDPAFSGSFKVQISDSLAYGSWIDITPPHETIDVSDPNFVVYTLPAGELKKFCRLHVSVAP